MDNILKKEKENIKQDLSHNSLFGSLASKRRLTDRDFQEVKKSIVKDIDLGKQIKKPH